MDTPLNGATVQQPFDISGWAADVVGFGGGPGVDTVHVWAYPAAGGSPVFVGAAEYGRPRGDVAALLGSLYVNSGYGLTVRGLTPGVYTLVAFGRSTRTGAFSLTRSISITIGSSVRLVIDTPKGLETVAQPFEIAGWAIDGAAVSGTGIDAIHVWAFPNRFAGGAPVFLGAASLGDPRPDVAAIYGSQFAASGTT